MDFKKCYLNDKKILSDSWQGTIKGREKFKDGKYVAYAPDDDGSCKKDELVLEKIPPQNIYFFKGLSICGTT